MAQNIPESPLEEKLKKILENSVTIAKQRLKSKSQLAQLQNVLSDYSNIDQLVQIIDKVLKMIVRLPEKGKNFDDSTSGYVQQSEYVKLEQALQKYQSNVRNHIKNEQQFKLYCQELQAKVKDLQTSKHELVMSTKSTILSLKRQNEQLLTKIKKVQESTVEQKVLEQKRNTIQVGELRGQFHRKGDEKREKNSFSSSGRSLKKSNKQSSKAQTNLRAKLDHYTKVMEQMDFSRSRKGSVSSLKVREKKHL